jgi:transcriptional regulator with XRE-family HTH domain
MLTMMAKTFGQRIRELRDIQDFSLRDFAKRLGGLSAAHLSDIELGRRFPSPELLQKMAQILDVSIEDLRKYDSRPPVEDIKRMSEANPAYGFALRKMVERNITPEEIETLLKTKSEAEKKNEDI